MLLPIDVARKRACASEPYLIARVGEDPRIWTERRAACVRADLPFVLVRVAHLGEDGELIVVLCDISTLRRAVRARCWSTLRALFRAAADVDDSGPVVQVVDGWEVSARVPSFGAAERLARAVVRLFRRDHELSERRTT